MTNDHDTQRHLITMSIQHLELAKHYSTAAWDFCSKSSNALLADYEPQNIDALIEAATRQLEQVGAEWDIYCSVEDK